MGTVVLAVLSCGAIVIAADLPTIRLRCRVAAIEFSGHCSSDSIPSSCSGGALIVLGLLVPTALIHSTASTLL
jgi:hypothetical protein